jgi:hypothetical protein
MRQPRDSDEVRIVPKTKPTTPRPENTKTCQPYSCICDRAGKSLLSVTYFTSTFSLLGIFMGKLTEFVDSLCNGHWISELTA